MDQVFHVCDNAFGKHGFWEGFVQQSFLDYIVFNTSVGPKLYVVKGSGGPGNVKGATSKDMSDMESSQDVAKPSEYDIKLTSKWFDSLKEA